MRKILVALSLISFGSAAFAQAPNTTRPNVSNTLSQCLANVPVVGNGAGAAPVCYGSALGALASVTPGTGIAAALAINVGSAGAPVLFNGALGTPSSGVATNLTGTAAGLTAGNVTTNANLTGPITSVGNATTIGVNQVSRSNQAQGVALSVIGVAGNATANVADIQLTANQFLGVNSAGTALGGQSLRQAFGFAPVTTVATAATIFFATAGANSTEVFVSPTVPLGGTFKNGYFSVNAAAGASQSFTFTLRVNGASTSITCSISGASATTCNDTTHTATITAGQTWSIQMVSSAAATNNVVPVGSIEFDNP